MIVLDASAATEMLLRSNAGEVALSLVEQERLAVPAHFDAEVYAAIRRQFRRGLVVRNELDVMTSELRELAAERVALSALLLDAHVLADRVSSPDAFYVALARRRDCELVTTDAPLARAANSLARIRLVTAPNERRPAPAGVSRERPPGSSS